MTWQHPVHCDTSACVEVSRTDGPRQMVFVRDSQRPNVMAWFDPAEWETFLAAVKAGEYDNRMAGG